MTERDLEELLIYIRDALQQIPFFVDLLVGYIGVSLFLWSLIREKKSGTAIWQVAFALVIGVYLEIKYLHVVFRFFPSLPWMVGGILVILLATSALRKPEIREIKSFRWLAVILTLLATALLATTLYHDVRCLLYGSGLLNVANVAAGMCLSTGF